MFEKKFFAVVIVLLTLFSAPVAANATPAFSPTAVPSPIFQDDGDELDDEEDHDDEKAKDDDHHATIPPVFVVPRKRQAQNGNQPKIEVPVPTQSGAGVQSLPGLGSEETDFFVISSIDPQNESMIGTAAPNVSKPIDVKNVRTDILTPADRFMDSAYLAMGALAVGAVGLGSVAGVRTLRARRNGESDYFYDNE